jgi:anti-sigma-K factor RskA
MKGLSFWRALATLASIAALIVFIVYKLGNYNRYTIVATAQPSESMAKDLVYRLDTRTGEMVLIMRDKYILVVPLKANENFNEIHFPSER